MRQAVARIPTVRPGERGKSEHERLLSCQTVAGNARPGKPRGANRNARFRKDRGPEARFGVSPRQLGAETAKSLPSCKAVSANFVHRRWAKSVGVPHRSHWQQWDKTDDRRQFCLPQAASKLSTPSKVEGPYPSTELKVLVSGTTFGGQNWYRIRLIAHALKRWKGPERGLSSLGKSLWVACPFLVGYTP